MQYGFTTDGFVVLDDAARVAEFCYATSTNYVKACREPEATARRMLANTWKACPAEIRERNYLLHNAAFLSRECTRWPVKTV